MGTLALALGGIFAVATTGLVIASIWTTGLLSDRLALTSLLAFTLAVVLVGLGAGLKDAGR